MLTQFYTPSGSIDRSRLKLPLATGFVAVVALSAFYGWAQAAIGVIIARLVMLGALAAMLGGITERVIERAHIRNLKAAGILGAAYSICALWAAWTVFAYELISAMSDEPVSLTWLIVRPDVVAAVGREYITEGVLTFHIGLGRTPTSPAPTTGFAVWLPALLEAITILVVPMVMARRYVKRTPYCEKCGRWSQARVPVLQIGEANRVQVEENIASAAYEKLAAMPLRRADDEYWYNMYLGTCPSCDELNTLTVEEETVKFLPMGPETVLGNLVIPAEHVERIEALERAREDIPSE